MHGGNRQAWDGALGLGATALVAGFLSFSCSSGKGDAVPAGPVAECVAYQNLIGSCFHRALAIADDPSLIPKTRADRDRIQRVCADNLTRLRRECR
jgi:hypothetical protein